MRQKLAQEAADDEYDEDEEWDEVRKFDYIKP